MSIEALLSDREVQTTLDAGVPLSEVTFCIVDLETTGGSPATSRITEIGAVKYRGGELLGTFEALVNPGVAIPPFITHLTGITNYDVAGQPPIEAIMPAWLEFSRDTVFVAHSAQFDYGFLNAELLRLDYPPIEGPAVCTARLARRVVWPDVPNVKLATLSQYFHTAAKPTHRALDDAKTCAEVLHALFDLSGRLGILTLGDLHNAVRARGQPNFHKIAMTDDLPKSAGVYLFRGSDDSILYVGKSTNIRQRVKTYFYGDGRKKVQDLLGEVERVEAIPCANELEALVTEARLICRHEPKYNRRGKTWRRYAYLKFDTTEAWPRIKVVYDAKAADGVDYIGPFRSSKQARLCKEALEDVFPVRRCTRSMGTSTRFAACALADMGRCLSPCDGRTDQQTYRAAFDALRDAFAHPLALLETLETRMDRLAADERFEEAALARDRLRAIADAISHERMNAWLLATPSLVLGTADGTHLVFHHGALAVGTDPDPSPIIRPCPRDRADELAEVRRWLLKHPATIDPASTLQDSARQDIPAPPIAEPVDGGAELARILASLKRADRSVEEERWATPRQMDERVAAAVAAG